MLIHKLGKKPPLTDERTLKMSSYRGTDPIIVPADVTWLTKVPANGWPMFMNDTLGCCVPAAAAHMIEQWTTYAGNPIIPTDADVLKAYEDVGGYVPGDPSTDNGCDMLTMLNYWRTTGVAGHKIFAFVAVNPKNPTEIREAIYLFGNVFTGLQLPLSVQGADTWTVPPGGPSGDGTPGSWGGHCVLTGADSPMADTCVTWGQLMSISPEFPPIYVDELFAVLSTEWIEANGVSPGQFNLAQLEADLQVVTG